MVHTWFVDRLVNTRSASRMGKHRELHWKVLWNSGEVTYEPLGNLVNDKTYVEDIKPVLEDYVQVAKRFPDVKRKCITCNRKTYNGAVFCGKDKRCLKHDRNVRMVMT